MTYNLNEDFHVEFIDFLGEVRNDSMVNGKSFIFKVLDKKTSDTFECILFVHPTIKSFLTIAEENYKVISEDIKELILKQFKEEELLNFKR